MDVSKWLFTHIFVAWMSTLREKNWKKLRLQGQNFPMWGKKITYIFMGGGKNSIFSKNIVPCVSKKYLTKYFKFSHNFMVKNNCSEHHFYSTFLHSSIHLGLIQSFLGLNIVKITKYPHHTYFISKPQLLTHKIAIF